MDENARQLSYALESIAKALAEWSVSAHEDRDASLPERFGPQWRSQWTEEVRTRIAYLAQAVAMRQPLVYAETLRWSGVAYLARDVGERDLATSVACMHEVLREELPALMREPINRLIDEAEEIEFPASGRPKRIAPDQPHGELILRYLEALLEGKRQRAEAIIMDAARNGTPIDELYLNVLQPAMTEVGRMWHLNELTVADEHFATATTEAVMVRLRAFGAAPESNGYRLVATSISGDLHSLGVRMVADFFEMSGWQAILLGANTPTRDIVHCLLDKEPNLLAVSITSTLNLRNLGELILAVRATVGLQKLPILVGGDPFRRIPGLVEELNASGCADSAAKAVLLGQQLVEQASARD